jgi:excisionase family DNA binding protein
MTRAMMELSPVINSSGNSAMKLLLAHEAAALLRVPPNRVYELAKRGVIPCVHIGRLVRFSEGSLLDWISAGGTRDDREIAPSWSGPVLADLRRAAK